MFRPFNVIAAVLAALVFIGSAAAASVGLRHRAKAKSAISNDIIRDEPLICDYLPWWPGCGGEDGPGGGGSGAGAFPD